MHGSIASTPAMDLHQPYKRVEIGPVRGSSRARLMRFKILGQPYISATRGHTDLQDPSLDSSHPHEAGQPMLEATRHLWPAPEGPTAFDQEPRQKWTRFGLFLP